MKVDMKQLGARIKAIRDREDLTQEAFGRLIGVQGAAISKYEKGDIDPGTDGLANIAEIGKVTVDWLITGKESGSPTKPPTREEALKEIAKAAYQGDKSFALSICEAAGLYTKPTTDPCLAKLIDAWPDASEEIQQAAVDMVDKSATRLRGRRGSSND
jgi:transcriptional regulator with XRE-family HTH domain